MTMAALGWMSAFGFGSVPGCFEEQTILVGV